MILSRLAVRRPVTVSMFFIAVVVTGIIAFARLQLAWLPQIDFPFIFIWAPYPNSSPSYVERYITRPIEEQLAAMGGYKSLESSSGTDGAELRLEYPWGEEMDAVRLMVGERLDRIRSELPADMMPIQIFRFDSQSIPVAEARISAEGIDLSRNYNLIDQRIVRRLLRIPGVAKVDTSGIRAREVQVLLRLDDLYRYRVPLNLLIQDLRSINADVPVGQVEEGGRAFSVRTVGRMDSLEELKEFPVLGGRLRLKEIADVVYEPPRLEFLRHVNGRRAVGVEIFKESTANTVEVARRIKSVINDEIDKDPLLKGIDFFTWNDQAKDIEEGLKGLLQSGLWGALLAGVVLLYFLRKIQPTLLVVLAIPFSLLMAAVLLLTLGKTLNILSMMGLMLAVGMLVDNCIVVLEAIVRRIWEGEESRAATLAGSGEVGIAVTASTLTTVIVFLPLLVGGKGQLFTWLQEVGITVTLTILCSLLVALTLIPLFMGQVRGTGWYHSRDFLEGVRGRYQRVLASTLRHPWRMAAVALLVLGVGLLPLFAGWVKMESFGGGAKNNRIGFRYQFKDTFPLAEVEQRIAGMEKYLDTLRDAWGIETVYSWMGEEGAGTILNLSRNLSDDEAKELRRIIREEHPPLPGMQVMFWHQSEEEGGRRMHFHLYADSMMTVQNLLPVLLPKIEAIEGLEDVHSDLASPRQEVVASLSPEKARRVGLAPMDLSRLFFFTLGSQRLHRFESSMGEVEVRFALREEDRQNMEDLKGLLVTDATDTPARLGDFADFRLQSRPTSIERENRKVGVGIQAMYEGKDFDRARRKLERILNGTLPPGVTWSFRGRMAEQEEEGKQMLLQFLLALVLIYCVMASLFESFSHPFAIMLAMPYALFGVSWFFLATGSPLNLLAQIGLLILMGIVVNNGIVFLDRVHQLRREGMPRDEALVKAGGDRLRPILMTASTTIMGLVPLGFGGAAVGDAYYYPLARTVIGGLLTSTFLTLLILPYIYTRVDATGGFLRRCFRRTIFGDAWRALKRPVRFRRGGGGREPSGEAPGD